MINIVIGNIIMLIGALFETIAGVAKTKNSTLVIQIVKYVIMVIGALFLGSVSCAIITCFMILRNILEYKCWLTNNTKYPLIIVACSIAILFNTSGWIGYIPCIAFFVSTIGISIVDVAKYKTVNAITCALFLINDIMICSYTSAIINLVSIGTNLYRATKTRKAIA